MCIFFFTNCGFEKKFQGKLCCLQRKQNGFEVYKVLLGHSKIRGQLLFVCCNLKNDSVWINSCKLFSVYLEILEELI